MRSVPRDLIETALRVNNAIDEVVIFILCDKMFKCLQLSHIKLQKKGKIIFANCMSHFLHLFTERTF